MEDREVREVYEYLKKGKLPCRLSGKGNKSARKGWKKKVDKLELKAKDKKKPLKFDNFVMVTVRRRKVVIVVKEKDLEDLWKKFHKDAKTGGHQGLHSMESRIQKGYFVKGLRKWLQRKIADCPICSILEKKEEVPPTATLVPQHPGDAWQLDYIGRFPCDSKNGEQYALVGIDCFSKYAMVSATYEQGDRHVWSSLEKWFTLNGKPKYIFSDNGGPFISECKYSLNLIK